jgi:hypothetical protein
MIILNIYSVCEVVLLAKFAVRLSEDFGVMTDGTFINRFKTEDRFLIRNRKLPGFNIVPAIISNKGRSMKMELLDLKSMGVTNGGISMAGYHKQRLKLDPEGILFIARHHAAQIYADDEHEPMAYKGYLVLACDTTKVNVPTTKETLDTFGDASGVGRSQAQAGLSCLYDVLNRQVLDASIGRASMDERGAFIGHIAGVHEVIGDRPFIVTLDRGYPSTELFCLLDDLGIPFVTRLKSCMFAKEISAIDSEDSDVEIAITSGRIAKLKESRVYGYLKDRGSFRLRIVKVKGPDDSEVILATNLDRKEFGVSGIAEIYRMRWGVETAFGAMKCGLQAENISAQKPQLIRQDIFATVYLFNLAFDLANEVERDLDDIIRQRRGVGLTYAHEMTVNKSYCIGMLKEDLIELFVSTPEDKQTIVDKIHDELLGALVPIRPDRHFKRDLSTHSARYNNTHKRSY